MITAAAAERRFINYQGWSTRWYESNSNKVRSFLWIIEDHLYHHCCICSVLSPDKYHTSPPPLLRPPLPLLPFLWGGEEKSILIPKISFWMWRCGIDFVRMKKSRLLSSSHYKMSFVQIFYLILHFNVMIMILQDSEKMFFFLIYFFFFYTEMCDPLL